MDRIPCMHITLKTCWQNYKTLCYKYDMMAQGQDLNTCCSKWFEDIMIKLLSSSNCIKDIVFQW